MPKESPFGFTDAKLYKKVEFSKKYIKKWLQLYKIVAISINKLLIINKYKPTFLQA